MTTPKDLIESQLPGYFLEQYPQFAEFVREYYNFLESSVLVLDQIKNVQEGDFIYGSLSKAKGVVKTVTPDRIYFDYLTKDNQFYKDEVIINGTSGEIYFIRSLYKNIYQYIADIEENSVYQTTLTLFKKYFHKNVSLDHSIFRKLDPKTLTKKILDYYKKRGTENSYYWFFRIFFDEPIDLYFPKVDILKLSDSGYYRENLVAIKNHDTPSQLSQKRIYGTSSKASAICRKIISASNNGVVSMYMDLVYLNGKFTAGEKVNIFDMTTGEKVTEVIIDFSVTDLKIADGGIGHEVGDEFRFADGRARVTKLEEYSITKMTIEDPGICYALGDEVIFENDFTGATKFAKAHVSAIYKDPSLTTFFNSQFNKIKNHELSKFAHVKLDDPLFSNATQPAKDSTLNQILPASMFPAYEVGQIQEITFEDSGLDYKFAPPAYVNSSIQEAQTMLVFDLLLDDSDANNDFIVTNTTIELSGAGTNLNNDAYYIGDVSVTNSMILLPGLLAEDHIAKRFASQRSMADLENDAMFTFTDTGGTVRTCKIVDLVNVQPLSDTAKITAHLGDGVAGLEILEPALQKGRNLTPFFFNAPETKNFSNPLREPNYLRCQHGLTFEVEPVFDVHHRPYEEYRNNQSMLSSDKYFFDNYYYQWYSYEIITKIPATAIEPLLLDELHPAGFLAFIRNRFDSEFRLRFMNFEMPEIEIESQGYCHSVIYPHMEQEWERFGELTVSQILQPELETDLMQYEVVKAKEYTEIDVDGIADIYRAFKYFIDDTVIPPHWSGVRRPWKFDNRDVGFGTRIGNNSRRSIVQRTVSEEQVLIANTHRSLDEEFDDYMSDLSEPHISTNSAVYDLLMATQSWTKLINVEDRANWIAQTIGTRSGPIETMADKTIHQHRVWIDDLKTYISGTNIGGMIIARDPFLSPITSANTLGATFDSDNVQMANSLADFSQSIFTAAADFSSSDLTLDSGNIGFSFARQTAFMPVVTGNSLSKQGAYLPDAEILTENGWVQFQNLEYGVKVAEVRADGIVKYTEPSEVYSTHFEGNIYTYTDGSTFSITVISDQELALSDTHDLLYKKKSSDINLSRTSDGIAIVDDTIVEAGKSPIAGKIPVKNTVKVIKSRYSGPLFCVMINNFEGFAKMPTEATEVDMDELELHYIIDNSYTLPEIYTDESKRVSEENFSVDLEYNQNFILPVYMEPIVFDYQNPEGLALHGNTANESNYTLTTTTLDANTLNYSQDHYHRIRNPYPEVAATEIFFLIRDQKSATGVPYGLVPSIVALPKTMSPSLEHVILARPDVNISLIQDREITVDYGGEIFHYSNTTNTYFSNLGFESFQFSTVDIDESFKCAPVHVKGVPESQLTIDMSKNYFELDANNHNRPIQKIVIENVQYNQANVSTSIIHTDQHLFHDWQRNYSVLVHEGESANVTILGFEQQDRNKVSLLSFETWIKANEKTDINGRPITYSKVNLYNIEHYELPEVISFVETRRIEHYPLDERININPLAMDPDALNDPRNRDGNLILDTKINAFQRSGHHGKLMFPYGFNSIYAKFDENHSFFDLDTIYYQPGELEVAIKVDFINITNVNDFKLNAVFDENDFYVLGELVVDPNIETNIYFAADNMNVQNAVATYQRNYTFDYSQYDLYNRQEFMVELSNLDGSSSSYWIVEQEREFEMPVDATIWMPDEFIFDRELLSHVFAYGERPPLPLFGDTPFVFDSKEYAFDRGYFYPHKGLTFWDKTNFMAKIEMPLLENWFHWDNELKRENIKIKSTLISGGIDPVFSYEKHKTDTANNIKTVLDYDLEKHIGNRWLYFDFDKQIRNEYTDWTNKVFDPWLKARSKSWLGDTIPSVSAYHEPTIYLAPMEKKIPMVEYVETGLEGNTNFIDSTINDDIYNYAIEHFHVEDRNPYFQTTDIIEPWVRTRIYDWFNSKFTDYFGDKIPSVSVLSHPKIFTANNYVVDFGYEATTTIYFPNTTFLDATPVFTESVFDVKTKLAIPNRNLLFMLDDFVEYDLLNDLIRNAFIPQRLVEYTKDGLPGALVIPQNEIEINAQINEEAEDLKGYQLPVYNADQIIYFPNTTFLDGSSSREVYKVDQLEGVVDVVNKNTSFALFDIFNHRWLKRNIKEFMKIAIRLRDWGGDTIPSVQCHPQSEFEYSPQLYWHYGKNVEDQYVDENFEGTNFSFDVKDYYIQDTIVYFPNTTFLDATSASEVYIRTNIEKENKILDSHRNFGLTDIIDFQLLDRQLTGGMWSMVLRDWATDTLPGVRVLPHVEIDYKPQLYYNYTDSKSKYVDENFDNYHNRDVQDYYMPESIWNDGNTTFFEQTVQAWDAAVKVMEDVNIYDSWKVFALSDKIKNNRLDYPISGDMFGLPITNWGGEAIPSVSAKNEPEITYKPQLYAHYFDAADKYVDEHEDALAFKDIQPFYSIDTTLYFANTTVLDATSDVPLPRTLIYGDVNVFDRNQYISLDGRIFGTDIIDHQIGDYLLAKIAVNNREHIPSVGAKSMFEITYNPQFYSHYKDAADKYVDDSPQTIIPQQNIQPYYSIDTTLYLPNGTFLEAGTEVHGEFNQIFTEKDHISDRFIIRGNELIIGLYTQRIEDYLKFELVQEYGEITRTVKTNYESQQAISIPRDLSDNSHVMNPLASPFVESSEFVLLNHHTNLIDSGIYAGETFVEYNKIDDLKVEESVINLHEKITQEFLDQPITHRELIKNTSYDVKKSNRTVDASSYFTFAMYNEFELNEDGDKVSDILKTKLKEVQTSLETEANFVDGSGEIAEKEYVFEFLNQVKNADRMIDTEKRIDHNVLNEYILDRMDTFEITDSIRTHLKGGSVHSLTEQMFEIKKFRQKNYKDGGYEYTSGVNSNTAIMTSLNLEENVEAPFQISECKISNINTTMLLGDDFLISSMLGPYLDVDIYKMNNKRFKAKSLKNDWRKFTNTNLQMKTGRLEGYLWETSKLNTFVTDFEASIQEVEFLESSRGIAYPMYANTKSECFV